MSDVFAWPVRVYYEDTDVGGVVYYANYLRFMERARTEYLRAKGFEQDTLMAREGVIFVVVQAEVTFRKPARFNDMLAVTVSIDDSTRTSVRFGQNVYRDSVDGELLVEGSIRGACLDVNTFRPRAIPTAIVEKT
ncbi:MAG: tol-pal system-associated acyl-CoA thioesterase [Pseudomonadota bacterium]